LDAHRGASVANEPLESNPLGWTAAPDTARVDTPRLKRYFNE
jgi:hypothetical protein